MEGISKFYLFHLLLCFRGDNKYKTRDSINCPICDKPLTKLRNFKSHLLKIHLDFISYSRRNAEETDVSIAQNIYANIKKKNLDVLNIKEFRTQKNNAQKKKVPGIKKYLISKFDIILQIKIPSVRS